MDDDLIQELYQSLILDHSKKPRNFGTIAHTEQPCSCLSGKNPSCGDELELCLNIDENNQLKEVKFTGQGCALFMSSTSLMTQAIRGKSIDQAQTLLSYFVDFIVKGKELPTEYEPLHIYKSVHDFPLRVKCVLLPWRTLEKTLIHNQQPIK